MAKSKVYKQDDDSKVSFEFGDDGKLIGIKKDGKSLDLKVRSLKIYKVVLTL